LQTELITATAYEQEILIAARNGGSTDPVHNLQLAGALRRARDQGVPKENIEKALAKARGRDKGGESLTYEALMSNSVGIIIECVTDNPNRTFNNIREILTDHKLTVVFQCDCYPPYSF